jgi:serine/threonine-protein kinase
MPPSVEHFCNALARIGLLKADQIRELRQRWMDTAGPQALDGEKFLAWVAASGAITQYQAGFIARDHADQLLLGPYTIQERVGKGRMAGVYKASHSTGTTVAIKILPRSKAKDPQTLGRFQREAKLAMRLKHPNLVRTFQTGESGGLHYLVMEYLEGEPFDKVLQRRGPLPPGEAARLGHQVLLGLQSLHEEGLVHRDIKPANFILVGGQHDNTLDGTLKLLDIGTGRALIDEEGVASDLTTDADMLGTPEYMAPEQARDPHNADIRADIYSLGCVLYHALAGRPPFSDNNRVRLLVRHATEQPRPVREFNPDVPDGLQQILNWMLAKDPARRYPTPIKAAQALQTFLAAGAEVVPLEKKPEMSIYMDWLAVVEGEAAAGAVSVEATIVPSSASSTEDLEEVLPVEEEEKVIEVEAQVVPDKPPRRRPPVPPPAKPGRKSPGREETLDRLELIDEDDPPGKKGPRRPPRT